MANRDNRTDALTDRLADHVLAHGLAASSLRPLARAAGTSDRMLLYYFADKDAVTAAALGRVADRMMALLDASAPPAPLAPAALRRHLEPLMTNPMVFPFLRVWLDMAARAAHGDATVRGIGARIGDGFLAWLARHLAVEEGQKAASAARLLIELEGTVLLSSLGMDKAISAARD